MDSEKLSRLLPTKQEAYQKRLEDNGWFYSIGAGLNPICFVAWLYYGISRRTITPFLWSYLAGLLGSGFVLGAIISLISPDITEKNKQSIVYLCCMPTAMLFHQYGITRAKKFAKTKLT